MREHAIPQDVTGYRFHIVGNMTLKQFAEVAIGFVIAIVLYKTNLIPIVKWPLMFLSAGSGILIAFVPIEERPLDHWLTTFFGVLYRPTQFYWRKAMKIPDPFLYKLETGKEILPEEVNLAPARQQRIHDYLRSVKPTQAVDPWEVEQKAKSNALLSQFDSIAVSSISVSQTIQKPNLQVRVRELQAIGDAVTADAFEVSIPVIEAGAVNSTPSEVQEPATVIVAESPTAPDATITTSTEQTPNITTNAPSVNLQIMQERSVIAGAQDVANQIIIPTTHDVQIETSPELITSEDGGENANKPQLISASAETVFMVNENSQLEAQHQATSATIHRSDLPFPSKPTVPNKVVGMVFTPAGKILPGAIVEIRNMKGEVARAVKTNPLGQFFITTPLESGQYVVVTEKTGYTFPNQQLTLENNLIDPIQIVSQA